MRGMEEVVKLFDESKEYLKNEVSKNKTTI